MMSLSERLQPISVNLDQLLLDPNNPRFAELNEEEAPVREVRYAEPRVQEIALSKLKNKKFDLLELRQTILELGFLPVDKVVVRKWSHAEADTPRFVVVEGNRRIAALKWINESCNSGTLDLNTDQLTNFNQLEVLLFDVDPSDQLTLLIIPGLRHVSGIQAWGPYQKALTVFRLRESGKTPPEAAQSIGLSTRAANTLWRSYLALEQMRLDEEFGEYAHADRYSFFEEAIKDRNVREWLGWSDEARSFTNHENLRAFYSWMPRNETGYEDEGVKLPEAKSARQLGKIIENPDAFSRFKSPEGNLVNALAIMEQPDPSRWHVPVENAITVIDSIPFTSVSALTREDINLLARVQQAASNALDAHNRLAKREDGNTES